MRRSLAVALSSRKRLRHMARELPQKSKREKTGNSGNTGQLRGFLPTKSVPSLANSLDTLPVLDCQSWPELPSVLAGKNRVKPQTLQSCQIFGETKNRHDLP